jgi:protein-tyrosine-phosphatase
VTRNLPTVLFVCVQNAGRSQIAQALFNQAVQGRGLARSAGSKPADEVHPVVVKALAEVDIDLAGAKPQGITPKAIEGVDVVVGMGCGDACPVIPGARKLDWDLPDPSGMSVADVRMIRDEIDRLVRQLAAQMGLI